MSEKYKIQDSRQLYFVSFATVSWIDVFIRRLYNDICVASPHALLPVAQSAWYLLANHAGSKATTPSSCPPMLRQQRLAYLHRNPVAAGFVDTPEDFLHSSIRNYAGRPGLLNVLLIN